MVVLGYFLELVLVFAICGLIDGSVFEHWFLKKCRNLKAKTIIWYFNKFKWPKLVKKYGEKK